jgi:ribose-phosphate pyrophosphokinase
MPPRIVLSGFAKFGELGNNPSEDAVRRIASAPPDGLEIETLVLPVEYGRAFAPVRDILDSGRALEKMHAIIAAQGKPKHLCAPGRLSFEVRSPGSGTVTGIDNLQMARIARYAGAPMAKGAGVDLFEARRSRARRRTALPGACRVRAGLPVRPRALRTEHRLHDRPRVGRPPDLRPDVSVGDRLPFPDVVLGFDDYDAPAARLAAQLNVRYAKVAVHRFPDGESRVTVPSPLPAQVAMCRSLDHPNDKLVETILAAEAARQNGARSISLIAPYLCYMRQDIAFNPGEAVSQRIVGEWLADRFDAVVTVDPHLHRVATLAEAVPAADAVALSAAALFGAYLQAQAGALLVGARRGVRAMAGATRDHRFETAVCRKLRRGMGRSIDIPDVTLRQEHRPRRRHGEHRTTLSRRRPSMFERGAAAVDVLVVHGLFVGDAVADLRRAGVRHVWSTDSVVHPTNALPLAPLLASAMPRPGASGIVAPQGGT